MITDSVLWCIIVMVSLCKLADSAIQHLCHKNFLARTRGMVDPVKIFLLSSLITVYKIWLLCVIHYWRMDHNNFWRRCDPPVLEWGVDDP